MEPLINPFFPVQAFEPLEQEQSNFEQLTNSFLAHEKDEQRFLEKYRDIAERHENPLMRFLLQMIISDEEKHHAVVHGIAASLNADLVGLRATGRLPKLGRISAEEKQDLLRLTAEFIQTEKDGIEHYKALLKPSRDHYGGLVVLLIETIIHDSEKHLQILRFIETKLRDSEPTD